MPGNELCHDDNLTARLAHDHPADVDHQADLVRERNEGVRREHAVRGTIPARERLDGRDAPARELDDRLVVHLDLVSLDGALETGDELLPTAYAQVHLRLVRRVAALPALFRAVHGGVGVAEDLVRGRDARDPDRDADARVDGHLAARDRERCVEGLDEARGDCLGVALAVAAGKDGELVPAQPGGKIAGADGVLDASCDRRQELVARMVAEAVVDRLEIVEIEKEHCGCAVGRAVE